MLKQSFTADNFEDIYDLENRRRSIKAYLGSSYSEVLAKIKELDKVSKGIIRKKVSERSKDDIYILEANKDERNNLLKKKKEVQRAELEKISNAINKKNFKFHLKKNEKDGKDIFVIQENREAFFAIKQLQNNIKRTFKVKQSDRHLILSQLKLLLNESAPKYLIRVDIKDFFESIPQQKLLDKILNNTLLSVLSKKFITQILEEYNEQMGLSGDDVKKGVPRGVGISSYLAELYLKDIDNKVKSMNDVIYYARYVDDIIIIISPSLPKKEINDYFNAIDSFFNEVDLEIHATGEKCKLIDLTKKNSEKEDRLTYLGYTINITQTANNKIETKYGLSEKKKRKIEDNIKKSILHFNEKSKYGLKEARQELLLCLRFLTTNTRLSGAKSKVKTGIYFSNSLLDNDYKYELECLNDRLEYLYDSSIDPYENLFLNEDTKNRYISKLKTAVLARSNFKNGFENKTYHYFQNEDLKKIQYILK